jgi:putative transposase
VVRGILTRATLKEFHRLSQENNGFPRYAVTSGRVWLNLNHSGQPLFSVMAVWNPGLDRPDGPAAQVVRALKVKMPIYLVSHRKYIPPYTPEQNSLCERFIRTFKEECAWQHRFENLTAARTTVARYIEHYNTQRSHSALKYNTPRQTDLTLCNPPQQQAA